MPVRADSGKSLLREETHEPAIHGGNSLSQKEIKGDDFLHCLWLDFRLP